MVTVTAFTGHDPSQPWVTAVKPDTSVDKYFQIKPCKDQFQSKKLRIGWKIVAGIPGS